MKNVTLENNGFQVLFYNAKWQKYKIEEEMTTDDVLQIFTHNIPREVFGRTKICLPTDVVIATRRRISTEHTYFDCTVQWKVVF